MATPEGILELFIGDASKVVDANLTAALDAHVKALSEAGYSGVKVLDEALLFLLHRGESQAVMREAGLGDSLGIRPVITDYADYPKKLRRDWKPAAYNLINRRRNVQLMVTRECNLRCAYCPVKKDDRAMSDKVMFRSVDFLLSSAQENLRLDFTGGEPLYYFNTIEKACHYGRAKAQGLGKKLTFYLITNGT
ncbi:MAG: radical SAM protein, partial [Pseudomonadota bacterium]